MVNRFVLPALLQSAFQIWHVSGFCEAKFGGMFQYGGGKQGNYWPEYGNSFSAIWMAVVGIHMLLFWDSQSPLFSLLASLFIVNGWGSFMFHYYGDAAWGSLDADSMTLAALMMWGFVVQMFLKCYVHRKHSKVIDEGRFTTRLWMGFTWMASLTFAFWVMTGANVPGSKESLYTDVFELSFGAPIVGSIILVLIAILRGWVDHDYITKRQRASAIKRFFLGFAFCAFGFLSWVLTEKLCAEHKFFQVMPGHLLWHIAMPAGMMNMLILIVFLQAPSVQKRPRLFSQEDSIGKLKQWYFWFMPAFHFVRVEPQAEMFGDQPLLQVEESLLEVEGDLAQVVKATLQHGSSAMSLDPNHSEVEDHADNLFARMEGLLSDEKFADIERQANQVMTKAGGASAEATRLLRTIEVLDQVKSHSQTACHHVAKHSTKVKAVMLNRKSNAPAVSPAAGAGEENTQEGGEKDEGPDCKAAVLGRGEQVMDI